MNCRRSSIMFPTIRYINPLYESSDALPSRYPYRDRGNSRKISLPSLPVLDDIRSKHHIDLEN